MSMRCLISPISRRDFATATAAASAFASVGIVTGRASAQTVFRYDYSHSQPTEYPLHTAAVRMWNAVREETNGRLDVRIHPNGQLGSDAAVITQLRSGAVQFTTQSGATLSAVVPVTGIENLPFAFKSTNMVLSALDGRLGEYLRKEMLAQQIYCFPKIFNLGFRQITASDRPIRTVDDFNGFKIRTPQSKIFVDVFKTLGASPTAIGFNELYIALQTRVVDGQETPYSVIETSKFYEVQKYLSVTNHMWTGWWLIANNDAWTALPDDIRAVVSRNADKYISIERSEVEELNVAVADKLRRQGLTFNTADVASFQPRLHDFYARWKDAFGFTAWSLLESYTGKLG